MPHAPVMLVTRSRPVQTMLIRFRSRHRRGRPVVISIRVILHHLGKYLVKNSIVSLENRILFLFRESVLPSPSPRRTVSPSQSVFIIPTPQSDTRMIPNPNNIINSLLTHVIQELLIPGIHRTGKHEILPHHDPVFITEFKKCIILVYATTPYSDHIHVGIRRICHHFLIQIRGYTRQKHVIRDSVSPLGKHGYSIQLEAERLSPLILFSN